MNPVTPDTEVPADESPAAECAHCGRPFRAERSWALHVGEEHDDTATHEEREAYEEACDDEEYDLFGFHIKVFVIVGVVQALVVLLYMIAFGSGYL